MRHLEAMKHLVLILLLLACLPSRAAAGDEAGVVRETIESGGKRRTYRLFVPARVAAHDGTAVAKTFPLVVVFHGSGQSGASLVGRWKELAGREGVIVAGPEAADSSKWTTPDDGPEFIHDLVEHLKTRYPVDARRVYLFGYSAGSGFAINISLLESRYFAATAVFASATFIRQYASAAERRIPFLVRAGTDDQVFPIREVRATAKSLTELGFPVDFKELVGRDHGYHRIAAKVNEEVWQFFSRNALEDEPDYRRHNFKR